MDKKRVVITGIGMVSPLGNDNKSNWESAINGKSGIGKITRFDASSLNSQIAGEVKGFDPTEYMTAKEAKKMDVYSQYAVAASSQALKESGLNDSDTPRERIGCIYGVGIGGLEVLEANHKVYLERGPRRISPFLIPSMISNLGPGNIAIAHDLRGVNFTISSACSSATHAIGESVRMIQHGVVDACVTGGAESAVTPIGIGGFCAMKALSTRNDEPTLASRPFDKDRDGFVLSEGSVALVLESLESAKRRNANIYAEVIGYGASCDASHITAPNISGAINCMKYALESAGLNADQINYVNTHGTSTPLGDVSETKAIKEVFGDYAKNGLVVSSTKSMTGHLLGAAGAIEAALSAMMIRNSVILPTINLDNTADDCDLDYVPNTAREKQINYCLSNSFGFGGTNASLIFASI